MTAIAHTKRKRDATDDVAPEALYEFVKRRRNRPIETGLAALSLAAPMSVNIAQSPTSVEQTTPASLDACKSQNPSSSTEERSLPEIQMRSSSWYEPEKDSEYEWLFSNQGPDS